MRSVLERVRRPETPGDAAPARRRHGVPDFALDRLSGVYVAIVLALVYSVTVPVFRTVNVARTIASSQAIVGILTLGLMVALICGVFDVSIAANMSFAVSLVGWLQADHGMNWVLAVLVTLLCGAAVGVANAIIVTRLHVEAVIGTLGTMSILTAASFLLVRGQDIFQGISSSFISFGSVAPLTVPISVYYLAALAIILYFVLGHTTLGRYFYAVGANADACRLAGIRVIRYQWTGLVISGVVASLAGVIYTMQQGAASYGAGDPYLLPAFAAAFLGSTQIKPGRFNVVGTLVAIYLLAIGVEGLQLQYPDNPWIADLFNGLALILAVALSQRSLRRRAARARA
jgi:ribose transport system permease protein